MTDGDGDMTMTPDDGGPNAPAPWRGIVVLYPMLTPHAILAYLAFRALGLI